jgi:hypothetical protein
MKSPRLSGGRRTEEERKTAKCSGEIDPVTFQAIDPSVAIRLYDNGKYFCFDAPALAEWFRTSNSYRNPFTNFEFSEGQINKFYKKLEKIYEATKVPDPVGFTPQQAKEALNNLIYIWDDEIFDKRDYNPATNFYLNMLFAIYDENFGKNSAYYTEDNLPPQKVAGNGLRFSLTILALSCIFGSFSLTQYFIDVKGCNPSTLDVMASLLLQNRFYNSAFNKISIKPLSILLSRNVQKYGLLSLRKEFQKYSRSLDKVKSQVIEVVAMSELTHTQKQDLIDTIVDVEPRLQVRRP